ncbi:MAG TPA: hypothetical protein VED46_07720 [Alphaproteobacteria bacterium]|nr:hypothetical protein [Alphaproteobacteria bacterium]
MKDLIEMIAAGMEPSSDEEIEQARQETLAQLKEDAEDDQPWEDTEAQHQPGTHGFHSALHTIQLHMDNIERHILANPAVVLDAGAYLAAYRSYEALADAFQELAAIALERAMGELDDEDGDEGTSNDGRT